MATLYERLEELCAERGIKGGRMCTDLGISKSLMTDLKSGRKKGINAETARKIAAYFDVSVGYLLGEEGQNKTPVLTRKDERDIARNLEAIMADLENAGDLMFDGNPMSEDARESMRNAIELGLKHVKLLNKETYTPKKYRKG